MNAYFGVTNLSAWSISETTEGTEVKFDIQGLEIYVVAGVEFRLIFIQCKAHLRTLNRT
jgi:hypothetical protein